MDAWKRCGAHRWRMPGRGRRDHRAPAERRGARLSQHPLLVGLHSSQRGEAFRTPMAGQSHPLRQLCPAARCCAGGDGRIVAGDDLASGLRLRRSDELPKPTRHDGRRIDRHCRRTADSTEKSAQQIAGGGAGKIAGHGRGGSQAARRQLRSGAGVTFCSTNSRANGANERCARCIVSSSRGARW